MISFYFEKEGFLLDLQPSDHRSNILYSQRGWKATAAVIYILYSSKKYCCLQNISCLRLQPRSKEGSLFSILLYHRVIIVSDMSSQKSSLLEGCSNYRDFPRSSVDIQTEEQPCINVAGAFMHLQVISSQHVMTWIVLFHHRELR